MILFFLACLPDLSQRLVDVDTSAPVDTSPATEGPVTLLLDATDYTLWVDLDLDLEQGPWELRFQRYIVELNPGNDAQDAVQALWLEGVDFGALGPGDIPQTGWSADQADQDGDGEPERVFDDWYLYDGTDHSLTPFDRVYLVRGTSGTFKFVFESYYSEAGTPAKLQLRWQRINTENTP
ncbi:MAG: hypothetical protein ACI9VR_002862 [Cognaticolwellia sp.]|jgi:hypothetical protein